MYTLGVDIGSASSKAVMLKDGKEVVATEIVQHGTGTTGPKKVIDQIYANSGLTRDDMEYVVVTGYGRFAFEGADKQVSEISAHAKGIYFLVPTARTIIDIGGQDAKAIRLDNKGGIKQFFMNDKCAAGTGRFLEVMSGILETTLDEMEILDESATDTAPISSTCTVFAESEVISQLSSGESRNNIIKGVHLSVASRACGLAYRGGVEADVVMTGGVAQNQGVVRAVEYTLKTPVIVAPNPQSTGALGAALFAFEATQKKEKEGLK